MRNIGIRGLVVAALSFTLTPACASKSNGGDSETNWIACKTTADCHGGQVCEAEKCVDPITLADGGVRPEGGAQAIVNPTGTCQPPAGDDGSRPGYHQLAPGDLWLPDCKNVLNREYFRVFARTPKSAYVLPRPDGAAELQGPCGQVNHPLRALVDEYSLCEAATDPATVDRINSMKPEDALSLTHFMHTGLVFMHVPQAVVAPFAIPSDVLDACALHPDQNSAQFQTTCDQAKTAPEPVDGTAFFLSADELVKRLNELYGIGKDCTGETFPARVCTQCGPAGGCAELGIICTFPCTEPVDCANAAAGPNCWNGMCQQNGPCD